MTREIKFRAWDIKDRRMIQSYAHGGINNRLYIVSQADDAESIELMQYTGLKDKNDKEIYEGDIISVFYASSVELDCWKAVVKWCGVNPAFVLERVNSRFLSDIEYDFVKCGLLELLVIGNIYENPELLEAKND